MGARYRRRHAATGGLTALLVTTALAGGMAKADETANERGRYVSISGMWVKPKVSDISGSALGHTKLKLDSGFGLSAAFGWGAAIGPRGEIELGYRSADFDEVRGSPRVHDAAYKGDVKTWSLMGNALYVFEAGGLRPYLGAGIGMARHKGTQDAQTAFGYRWPHLTGSVTVFAYQAMAGVGYPMSDSTETRGGYRYFATGDGEFEDVSGIRASYGTHSFEAGVVFRF